MQITTNSEKETIELGKKIAKDLSGGDILLLKGELGAGKTTFVKGLAQGLEIENIINSPTFTLMNIYKTEGDFDGIKKIAHIDTYRLEDEDDLVDIGVTDYLGEENTLCIVEWPEKIEGLLKNLKTIEITIEHLASDKRKITIVK